MKVRVKKAKSPEAVFAGWASHLFLSHHLRRDRQRIDFLAFSAPYVTISGGPGVGARYHFASSCVNFSHQKTCDACGATYNVVLLAWGAEDGPGRRPTGKATQIATSKGLAWLREGVYHRCTECGCYDQEALRKIRGTYPRYRVDGIVKSVLSGGIGVLAVAITVRGLVSLFTPHGIEFWPGFLGLSLVASLVAVIAIRTAWQTWPAPAQLVFSQIVALNDPDITTAWLTAWRNESPQLLTVLNGHDRSALVCGSASHALRELSHRYDPIPVFWRQPGSILQAFGLYGFEW